MEISVEAWTAAVVVGQHESPEARVVGKNGNFRQVLLVEVVGAAGVRDAANLVNGAQAAQAVGYLVADHFGAGSLFRTHIVDAQNVSK